MKINVTTLLKVSIFAIALSCIINTGEIRAETIDSANKQVVVAEINKDASNEKSINGTGETIGYYQTYLGSIKYWNSVSNALKAADYINGIVVEPGQTFSFNGIVGERTRDRGFVAGPVAVAKGKPNRWDTGGGICMTASVLHQAVKSAKLQVVERHDHVSPVAYLPQGEDAAIWWGVEDYKFYNNTGKSIKIIAGAMNNYEYIKIQAGEV